VNVSIAEKSATLPAETWFNWNSYPYEETQRSLAPTVAGSFFDETLRDGLQAANIPIPEVDRKIEFIHHMVRCGVRSADLGFPGSGPEAARECTEIAKYIAAEGLPLVQGYAGRTHPDDIAAICGISQAAGVAVEAYVFTGVSPIRQHVEDWSIESIQQNIRDSAKACDREGVEFVLVLEDTVRCTPKLLAKLYDVAIDSGVRRVTLCDTVGTSTPAGTEALIRWTTRYFADRGHPVGLEWHGHNDRGLALANSLTALALGCVRVHGTILGIGERAGNTALDQLIVNGYLGDHGDYDLLALREYCEFASEALELAVPENYPAMGRDVFKTSAGVHATAILKAHQKGSDLLKDIVYSGVPASALGREQEVLIDASSGANNVRYWLTTRGYQLDSDVSDVIEKVLHAAKSSRVALEDEQIRQIIAEH
jgi:2-isopropylmalate synthase